MLLTIPIMAAALAVTPFTSHAQPVTEAVVKACAAVRAGDPYEGAERPFADLQLPTQDQDGAMVAVRAVAPVACPSEAAVVIDAANAWIGQP